jgi:hypothetical protein
MIDTIDALSVEASDQTIRGKGMISPGPGILRGFGN